MSGVPLKTLRKPHEKYYPPPSLHHGPPPISGAPLMALKEPHEEDLQGYLAHKKTPTPLGLP